MDFLDKTKFKEIEYLAISHISNKSIPLSSIFLRIITKVSAKVKSRVDFRLKLTFKQFGILINAFPHLREISFCSSRFTGDIEAIKINTNIKFEVKQLEFSEFDLNFTTKLLNCISQNESFANSIESLKMPCAKNETFREQAVINQIDYLGLKIRIS